MKRLSLIGSWKRLGLQVGLLAGVGFAFIGGTEPPPAAAEFQCLDEGMCTFKKPLFLFIADYSTSMNKVFDQANNVTRWEAAVDAIVKSIEANNGFLSGNLILGLMRFGHDPMPASPNTPIKDDTSGIIDGQKLDVGWYDAAAADKAYYECNGQAVIDAIQGVPAPINGAEVGIGTWTKGALDRAKAYIAQTKADHPQDALDRPAAIVILTDGEWTDPTGVQALKPATQDPAITAGDLWTNQQIATYVVAIGEAMGKAFADQLAAAGGTMTAYDAANPEALVSAVQQVVQALKDAVVAPTCTPGLPRIMVLVDASSSMLNINNGTQAGGMGTTGWDQARDALAGANSLFDQIVNNDPTKKVENLVHLGLAVFGHNMPAEQKLLVDYGPCRKDNFAWALDPVTSCVAPDCQDPWGGPPIKWTFQDGTEPNQPGFDEKTVSHMPKCDFNNASPNACIGSGTYTHLGLQLIQQNIATYKGACQAMDFPYACSDDTEYINILVTDGKYNSTDPQVQGPLTQMYGEGILTYVIGFGDAVDVAQLNKMADWGSGNTLDFYDANNQAQLEDALKSIIEQVTFDPCCQFNNCDITPEPTTLNIDPDDNGETDTDTDGTTGEPGTTTDEPETTTETPDTSSTDPTNPVDTDTDGPGTTTVSPTTDTDPSTGNIGETEDPTGPQPTTSGSPTSDPTTNPDPTVGPETGGEETDSDGSATTGVNIDDEGCGCSVDDEKGETRGLLASLLTFGLAGFIRRRRRSA